jgi:hypothetical protein
MEDGGQLDDEWWKYEGHNGGRMEGHCMMDGEQVENEWMGGRWI